MIQHIILPQIGLAQDKYFKTTIQGAHCMLETPYTGPTMFGSHDPTYYTTSDWLGTGQNERTPYRKPTVFGKRHIRKKQCSEPMIQNILLPQIGPGQNQK